MTTTSPTPELEAARRELAARALARLERGVDAELGELLVHPGGRADYWGDGVVVRAHDLRVRCPARLAHPADDYADTTRTTARRVGLIALRRRAAGSDEPLPAAVAAVMGDLEDWPGGLRDWVGGLDRAGRAAVASAASAWGIGALRLTRGGRGVQWTDPARTFALRVPGRLVQLQAPWDALRGRPTRPDALLVTGPAVPEPADRVVAGFAALVYAAGPRTVPGRVVVGSVATGEQRPFPVDDPLLELAVDRVVEVVGHLARPDDAPPVTGPDCRWCHLLESCPDGMAALAPPPPSADLG